jgi:hypothetical protein
MDGKSLISTCCGTAHYSEAVIQHLNLGSARCCEVVAVQDRASFQLPCQVHVCTERRIRMNLAKSDPSQRLSESSVLTSVV